MCGVCRPVSCYCLSCNGGCQAAALFSLGSACYQSSETCHWRMLCAECPSRQHPADKFSIYQPSTSAAVLHLAVSFVVTGSHGASQHDPKHWAVLVACHTWAATVIHISNHPMHVLNASKVAQQAKYRLSNQSCFYWCQILQDMSSNVRVERAVLLHAMCRVQGEMLSRYHR